MTDYATTIAKNAAVLDRLEGDIEQLVANGDYETAAAVAQIAAHFAWFNHPGRYCSPRLETALAAVSATLDLPERREPDPRRVLHVLTQAYPTGGHTRWARRWAELDTAHDTTVVLTNQRGLAVPDNLRSVRYLTGDLLHRAASLRALAADASQVVLYAHPYDVVPLLAFAAWPDRPPIIVADHVDHAFWLGVSVADVVACHRSEGRRVAVERRGVDPARCLMLPLPPAEIAERGSKEQARVVLGIAPSARVLLTVGDAYKYQTNGPGMVDALRPVLDADPAAVLIAVGPSPEGMWASYPQVRAVGHQTNMAPFWDAADVYLDSWPCSGATSAMEMAARGVPVLHYCPDADAERFYYPDPVGPDVQRCRSVDAYQGLLVTILNDSYWRVGLGNANAAAVPSPERWRSGVAAVYIAAGMVGPAPPLTAVPDRRPDDTADRFLIDLDATLSRFAGLDAAIAEHGHLIGDRTAWQALKVG